MDKMNITGRELAGALNVDYSLVSKWRNNQRPLPLRSIHLKNMVNYFILIDRSTGQDILKDLLKEHDPKLNLGSETQLSVALSRWLTESTPLVTKNKESYCTNFNVYKGNSGRRLAVFKFFDYILNSKKQHNLMLISQENMTWLTEDSTFLKIWQQKLVEILHKNHKIQIIHWIDRYTENLSSIINLWLPLYFTGNIESFYYPKYTDTLFQGTLFIIKNNLVVTGMNSETPNNRYTALYNDTNTLNHYQWMFKMLLSNCQPLVKVYPLNDSLQMLKSIAQVNTTNNAILVSNLPIFSTITPKLFEEILSSNNLDDETLKKCLKYYESLNSIHNTLNIHSIKHIFNKSVIETAVHSENIIYDDLSSIAGVEITVTKDMFLRHIQGIIAQLEINNNYKVGLITSNPHPINLWVQEENCVFTWQPNKGKFIVVSTEPTVVHASYHEHQQIWESIPRINRDKRYVIAKLQELIALV